MSSQASHPIVERLEQISQLVSASVRPLPPRFGDGRYDADVSPDAVKTGLLKDLASQALRIPDDIGLISEAISTVFFQDGLQDDKKYFMEKIIQFVASLPETSKLQSKLTSGLIGNLWNVLEHPPLSYVGDKYQYRQPDGSWNNIMYPHLGKANTEYAKSVKPIHQQQAALPDPGVLFDALLARKAYKPHPSRISSMLFYLATIIIHDLFKTSHENPNISVTSSYLDLAPLYGSSQTQQDSVRAFENGKLKPDCFVEERILGFPPGVSVLLICFNRFHNYVVGELAAINEGGRFTPPNIQAIEQKVRANPPTPTSDDAITAEVKKQFDLALAKYDNDLFQTARLVTNGLYINCILNDYVRTILGLNRVIDGWSLDPRVDGPNVYSSEGVPMGVGNQVSCEFNLLYRWHSAISDRDDKWTQEFSKKIFHGKDVSKLSLLEFQKGLAEWAARINPDPSKRNLDMDNVVRGKDGKFDDIALIQILKESTEDCAAAFDSGVPLALRLVEVLGIKQSRSWQTATLNEFRRFFGLIKHKTFEDISPDKRIAQRLRQLYDHPDNVELYPGLIIESPKVPMVPGSGLCPPQTIGKAILSDAVALVRGDRFYTVDYSPANLTHFGYTVVQPDLDIAQGGVIYRVLMRAFPGWFEYNSVYALFPFTVPDENKKIFTGLSIDSQFSFKPPAKPKEPTIFSTAKAAMRILGDQKAFKVVWGAAISRLTGGVDYMLSADLPANTKQRNQVVKALYTDVPKGMDEVWDFYTKGTEKLLRERSYELGDYMQVDAVRDIINMVHVHFTAQLFQLPLKTEENEHHPFTEKQLYDILALLFGCVFLDKDEVASWKIRTLAAKASSALGQLVMLNIKEVSRGGWLKKLADNVKKDGFLDSYGNYFIRRLLDMGMSFEEICWIIMPTAAAGTANQGQQSIQMLDVYFSEKYRQHWPEIVRLAHLDDKESRKKLRAYALEGVRLSTQSFGLFRHVAENCTVEEGGKQFNLKAGDEVFANLVGANVDPAVFPDPFEVKLDRPETSYVAYGWGPHRCIGQEINIVANTAILKCFARLPNLRRAPGPQGQLKYVMKQGVVKVFLQEDWGSYWFFPTTMKVHYDKK